MSDPLSVAASVAGLISLGLQSAEYLHNFYTAYRDHDVEIAKTTDRLGDLLSVIKIIDDVVQTRRWRLGEEVILRRVQACISRCEDIIGDLREAVQKFEKQPTEDLRQRIIAAGRHAAYPFRRSTLEKLNEDAHAFQDSLSQALDALQLKEHQNTQRDIEELKAVLAFAQAKHLRTSLREWLRAPDVTVDYNAAAGKRHANTGAWFTQSSIFKNWLQQDNSFLWLCGFAGSGKSVLCSTAIQQVFRYRQPQSSSAIAFFFFTFNDPAKQDASALLRTLLVQLSGQISDVDVELSRLEQSSNGGTPPVTTLIEYLKQAVTRARDVHILVDALDECQAGSQREEMLNMIETIRKWALPGLHLLVTSRDLVEIRDALQPQVNDLVTLKNNGVEDDIRRYVSHCVEHDPKLQRWKEERESIKDHLATRANGAFRWVDCQLEPLRRCPLSKKYLKRCLEALPLTLDETYERMLCSIDEYMQQDTQRMLALLCLAARDLSVNEVIEALAVDEHRSERYDSDLKLESSDDLLRICPGLVNIVHVPIIVESLDDGRTPEHELEDLTIDDGQEHDYMTSTDQIVRIAHFSVQEYLFSERIKKGRAAQFAVSKDVGHVQISKMCLIYLCNEDFYNQALTCELLQRYAFAEFAAVYWFYHFLHAKDTDAERLESWALALFNTEHAFLRWNRLYNVDADLPHQSTIVYDDQLLQPLSPLYCLASLGMQGLLAKVLENPWTDVEEQGGCYYTALNAASAHGHNEVVQTLLEAGAQVNSIGPHGSTALTIASERGHDNIAKILIDAGAEITFFQTDEFLVSALGVASAAGQERVVQTLLDAGADIEFEASEYGTPLQAASATGSVEVVQMLLSAGADVNGRGEYGDYIRPLHMASSGGYEKIVRMLLDAGADVNSQAGTTRDDGITALIVASMSGHEKIVQILLNAGADVNAQGGPNGPALHEASVEAHDKIVQMLLNAGADVKAGGTSYENALQAAIESEHACKTKWINAVGVKDTGRAEYEAARMSRFPRVIQLLSDAGADGSELSKPRKRLRTESD